MDRDAFERDHKIDPNELDVECARQPETFFRWAEQSVDAKGEVDRLKLQLEVLEARLELKIRKDPGRYALGEKTTEGAIKARVKIDDDYLELHKRYHKAKDESALLDKAVMAMEMKKRMLEVLVTLHGQNYFAGPSTPRDLGAAYLLQQQTADKRLNERQARVVRVKRAKE